MPKRHDNTIYKLSLGIKKTTKAILSSITRIGLIVYIKDPKEAPGVDYIYIEEDTKIEEIIMANITTTTHPVRNNVIFIINLNAS
jgi:predicted transcriptional regulator